MRDSCREFHKEGFGIWNFLHWCLVWERERRTHSIFHRSSVHLAPDAFHLLSLSDLHLRPPALPQLKGARQQDRVVLYFTSLRIVRQTFEDCYTVRSILHDFRVWIDERDLSIDRKYLSKVRSSLEPPGR
ncbi:unnamed protein product [Linum trigynum]|uniref:Uncharacterized protein n=1 Tax=Linum trigynum TaxID=586398 RepID=A0AAV2F7K9_9ROSI